MRCEASVIQKAGTLSKIQFWPAKGQLQPYGNVAQWAAVGSYFMHGPSEKPIYLSERLWQKTVLRTTLGSLSGDGLNAFCHILYRLDHNDPAYPQGAIDQDTFVTVFNGTVPLAAGYVFHGPWFGRTTDLSPYRYEITPAGTIWSSYAVPQAPYGPLSAITDAAVGNAFAASYALVCEYAKRIGSWR
jgi:hypothetical protein